MKYKIVLLLLITIVIGLNLTAGEISDRVAKSISKNFGVDVKFQVEKMNIPKEIKFEIEKTVKQKFYKNYAYVYKISRNDSILATAILDNVYGKVMPITFMVYFDKNGKILKSEVIKYREQYGGTITNPKWNKQFIGKDFQSDFIPSRGVDGISGATISVNSISRGIFKLTLLYNELFLKK